MGKREVFLPPPVEIAVRNMLFLRYGPIGHHASDEPETDFAAIHDGYVSITPLSLDMTAQRHTDTLTEWLDQKK